MHNLINYTLIRAGFGNFSSLIAYTILIISGVISCVILRTAIRSLANKLLTKAMERSSEERIHILIDSLLVKRASNLVIPIIIFLFAQGIAGQHIIWDKAAEISLVIVMLLIIFSCIKSVGVIYDSYEASKNFPIHGILQVATVAALIIGGIVIISILMDKNPTVLLGSVGAMTAIVTLIFKDAILGFVAGIQLTTNNMIRIGDWIEAPDHLANGLVIDITMTTVKVENFDKTIISIPAYSLISESFINWRGMLDTGARRIKRPFHIDAARVCICNDEMIEKFRKIALLKDYINNKLADIEEYNKQLDCDLSETTNGRRMTNIGVFRAYISAYLKQHPGIRQDLTQIVRHLDPGEKGIPMEVIAFVNATGTADFDAVQSDIFDHLYAVISEFDLKLYQDPSSNDIQQMTKQFNSLQVHT